MANESFSTVTYYDASGTQEGTFSAGINDPDGVAYSPSNEDIYVTNAGSNTVTYYDASGTEEGSFSADLNLPESVAIVP